MKEEDIKIDIFQYMKGKDKYYTKKELDDLSLSIIKKGEDVRYEFEGKTYILDIKEYEAQLRFNRPELFEDGR